MATNTKATAFPAVTGAACSHRIRVLCAAETDVGGGEARGEPRSIRRLRRRERTLLTAAADYVPGPRWRSGGASKWRRATPPLARSASFKSSANSRRCGHVNGPERALRGAKEVPAWDRCRRRWRGWHRLVSPGISAAVGAASGAFSHSSAVGRRLPATGEFLRVTKVIPTTG